jgi:DNA-binding NtrC family response regulator
MVPNKIVGQSRAVREVLDRAEKLADVPRPVLIRGERGTGKELLAEFIHVRGGRASGRFVAVNCAVYGEELWASELFGYEKGAFTGADSRRAGCIERAAGGTLFLDEIGNMSIGFQEKMLRVIETKRFERVGGGESLDADVRFISATNADMEGLIERGEFRADFYDRIAFETLILPPLRERKEDIPLLMEHFSICLMREVPNLEARRFSREAVRLMTEYYWPGNIRELRNVVERVQLREGDSVIGTEELPPEITAAAPVGETFEEKVEAYRQNLILTAWRDSGFNQKRAAERLGMSYDQFRHYFRKYGLKDFLP